MVRHFIIVDVSYGTSVLVTFHPYICYFTLLLFVNHPIQQYSMYWKSYRKIKMIGKNSHLFLFRYFYTWTLTFYENSSVLCARSQTQLQTESASAWPMHYTQTAHRKKTWCFSLFCRARIWSRIHDAKCKLLLENRTCRKGCGIISCFSLPFSFVYLCPSTCRSGIEPAKLNLNLFIHIFQDLYCRCTHLQKLAYKI